MAFQMHRLVPIKRTSRKRAFPVDELKDKPVIYSTESSAISLSKSKIIKMQRTRKNMPKRTPNFIPLYAVRREKKRCKFPTSGGRKGDVSRNMLKPQGMS